jgi:CO/xanthine dehydrogenase Mo-binding subunit
MVCDARMLSEMQARQPEIARLRVNRVVSFIDAGRILDPLAGDQIIGAAVT